MARSILVGALACFALLLAAGAGAQNSPAKYSINVAKQPLTPALNALSEQTHVSWGYSPDGAAQQEPEVGPVIGEYTVEEAWTLALRGTGYKLSWIDSNNIALVKELPPPPPPKLEPPRAPGTRAGQTAGIIAEVITWGTRYLDVDVLSPPVVVIDRKTIDRSGAATVMQVLQLLPQQPFLRPDGFRNNGAQYAELRGLGPDTTLVLINGRPAFASAGSFTFNAFDLNQVPLSAVERIEVQLDTISVRHGADAIGGIVNIVLRDDIPDPGIEVHYGAADGGGEERQAALSAGLSGPDGHATLVLDYRDVQPLFGVERELWRNQDYRRFGSSDLRSMISTPGNVMALPGMLLPGVGAPFAAIPEQTAGAITEPGEFLPLQINRTSLLQYQPIVAADRRASAVATAEANLTPDLVAAADLLVVDRRVLFESTPLVATGLVPATNPYNAFGQPVTVLELLDDYEPLRVSLDSLLIRGAASLHGKVKSWDWELSLLRSEEDAERRVENVVDPLRLQQVLADPDPQRTLNLLGPGPAGSPEAVASALAPPEVDNLSRDATLLTGLLSGRLFALPAGDVSTVLGTEWRKETAQFDSLLGSFSREIAAGFAELRVPLLSERMQLAAAHELTVTVAGRFDRYSDFGEIFNPQYGLVWRPLRDVEFRGTYGRSYRAPSLYELYLPREPTNVPITDPRRNGEVYTTTLISGGSRDLEPTRGESYTAGIEFTPAAIEPLTVSATYWHVTMDSRVTALTSVAGLLHEADVPDHVLRAEPTAAEVAAGLPGKVLQIDMTSMNFGRLTTSGIDLAAKYTFETAAGRFVPDLKATWINEYDALDLPGAPQTDRVDLASSLGTIAKWRGVASLDWQLGALGATTYLRYIPSYHDSRDGVRNGRTISSQTFVDLQFSMDIGKLLGGGEVLRGLELSAGALNALDQQPHFAEVNGIQGYDTSQGDLKGRFWYLRLGKTF